MNLDTDLELPIKSLTLNFSSKVIFIFITLFINAALSQTFQQKFDGINFNVHGNNSYAPFNGGVNNARFQFVDIDGDNDLDLFLFDSDTSLYFYQNIGTPQNANYKLITNRFQNLHFDNWFYFVDIDNDGDYDLFTGGEFQIVKYYRNDGTATNPVFNLVINELHTNSDSIIYSEANCVPVFCDIDGDGDKDFFSGQSLGTITYYENIGTQSNFSFKYITDFWQNLLIISPAYRVAPKINPGSFYFKKNNTSDRILNYSEVSDNENDRHGANSLEFADIDGNNTFDLFWGDLFSKGIYFIKNTGTLHDPNVAIVDSTYPHNSPYISHGFNSTRFVDIDADGDKDLFISVLYLSQNHNNFAFYRNEGTPLLPNFQRVTNDYLNNVDVGGSSNIRFVDIDNDGDKDLFIGSDHATISFFKNTGTPTAPSFTLISDSLPILSTSFNYAPAFADLDNDGDLDMILGSYIKDSVWFFRNTGTPTNFTFTLEARGYQIGLTTLGQSSTPTFVDIDNDGDQDLFIGATNGRIIYYQNTGTPSNFNFVYRTNFYDSIDAGDESIPRFFDIDHDGDYDLFIGKQDGKISYYENVGSPSVPNFVFRTNVYSNIDVHQNSCPEFVDLKNNTHPDLFVGNVKGGLFYFKNEDVGIKNISNLIPENSRLYQNYPNPFNPSTKIKFDLTKNSFVKLSIFDVSGRQIAALLNEKLNPGSYEYTWNAEGFASGIYFYRLETEFFTENKKMLFIK